ncbi:MAG: GntR family transcriptional regulator [Desulfuromonadales bacterium]|nr:GntR family transcriptional regulator [Desulfuromonadales bacterium]
MNDVKKDEKSLTEVVYHKIKQMMLDYEIIPGQRLIFSDLAKKMGVSRTPVNNALSILANEGFLDFVPNQGYTVHQITKQEAESLYEMREILEVGAIPKIIQKITPENIAKLEEQRRLFENAVADNLTRERFILDQEFHVAILEITGNKYLPGYFREIYQRIFLRHRVEGLRSGRAKSVIGEHQDLLEAIKRRDGDKAEKLVSAHIAAGKEYVLTSLFKDSA